MMATPVMSAEEAVADIFGHEMIGGVAADAPDFLEGLVKRGYMIVPLRDRQTAELVSKQRSLETMAAEVLDRNQRIAALDAEIARLKDDFAASERVRLHTVKELGKDSALVTQTKGII
jgi:uncharacterized small protein (DUF1192 family)